MRSKIEYIFSYSTFILIDQIKSFVKLLTEERHFVRFPKKLFNSFRHIHNALAETVSHQINTLHIHIWIKFIRNLFYHVFVCKYLPGFGSNLHIENRTNWKLLKKNSQSTGRLRFLMIGFAINMYLYFRFWWNVCGRHMWFIAW